LAKTSTHYVDNARFLAEIKTYRAACAKAKRAKQPIPDLPEYIGKCFLDIATHLSYKPNFVAYTYREDMISDGIENCLVYFHNFDPDKSSNPFGYFTQIIYYAFIRRIQKERKHTYIKYKALEQAVIAGGAHTSVEGGERIPADTTMLEFDNVKDFIRRFDDYTAVRKERRKAAKSEKL
jgi:hypothetical protein